MFKQRSINHLPAVGGFLMSKRDLVGSSSATSITAATAASSNTTTMTAGANEVVVKDVANLPPGTLQWINKHRPKYCGKVIPVHDAPRIALQLRALLADPDHLSEYGQDVLELKAVVDMVTDRFVGERSIGATENAKLLDSLFDSIDKDHSGIQDFAMYLVSNTTIDESEVEMTTKAGRLYRAFLELTNDLRRRKAQVTLSNPAASALTKYASFKKLFSMNYFAEDDKGDEATNYAAATRRTKTADGINRRKKEIERSKEAAMALHEKEVSGRASARSNNSITARLYHNPTTKVSVRKVVPGVVDEGAFSLRSARSNHSSSNNNIVVKLPAINRSARVPRE